MNKKNYFSIIVIFIAVALRLAVLFIGYHGDLNNNISWGELAYERGLNGFYGSPDARDWPYSAPNQPPVTLIMFSGIRALWVGIDNSIRYLNQSIQLFPSGLVWFWEKSGMILLVKLPSIIADILMGLLIFNFSKKYLNDKDKNKAYILFYIWLFNPLVWYNSSVWGQTDSVVNLLGLFAVMSLLEKRLVIFAISFALSFLFKGSLVVFSPLLLVVALYQRHSFKKWLMAGLAGLLVVFGVSVWFHPYPDLFVWLFDLYKNRILPGEIGYLTANAFNMWFLVSGGNTLDTLSVLGIPARILGFIIFGISYLFIIRKIQKDSGNYSVLFALSLIALSSFLFITRMHERYLYPYFPYATLLLIRFPKTLFPYIILSVIHLFNLYNLFWVPGISPIESMMTTGVLPQIFSIITIFCFIYLFFLYKAGHIIKNLKESP